MNFPRCQHVYVLLIVGHSLSSNSVSQVVLQCQSSNSAKTTRQKPECRNLSVLTDLFWTAPELIYSQLTRGTQKGDVYSFGVICAEMNTRHAPYYELTHLTPRGISSFFPSKD